MSGWVKVETRFTSHPKVLDIGPLGEALWLRGLCYAGDQLTDGFVPNSYIKRMGDMKGMTVAARLVAAGLWDETDDGFVIHDYLDWQRSRDEAEEISTKRAEAGRRGGKQKASNLLETCLANGKQKSSKPLADKNREDTDTDISGINPESPAPRKPVKPIGRAHRLPEDWEPGTAVVRVAQELHMDEATMGGELDKFRSHFRANGKTMIDWDQSAMNWLRRSLEFPVRSTPTFTNRNAHPKGPDFAARALERRRLEQTGT